MTDRAHSRAAAARRRKRRSLLTAVIVLSVVLAALVGYITLVPKDAGTLTLEVGSPLPQAADFLEGAAFTKDISGISMTVPGEYSLNLSKGISKYNATLIVRDSVAPTATAQDATVMIPGSVTAQEMVTDIVDLTDVTVAFEGQPDFSAPGDVPVVLVLTDLGGNVTKLDATVHVIKDTQAPTILGVQDLVAYVGGTLAYRNGITITDDYDQNATLTMDISSVDLSTAGTYKIIYYATDASGNTASE